MTAEWLVEIDIDWPPGRGEQLRRELAEAEGRRARELASAGLLVRLWRVPGRWANVGLWRAEDATELHAALCSLPLHPWMQVTVTALAVHPSDPQSPQPASP
ncbi:muconolactone delta-isomerase [Acidimicrobiaceae bacterium USS-CC1]|uniref:Muconolactone delta-isomerase n=1 Tax=Acidiferrimicrobium australe TaxID=2664430 RepID=A0ABW9QPN8_9ACTN|nr:muconolactone delta-isomerase [Acidiferrimicrobium australe]